MLGRRRILQLWGAQVGALAIGPTRLLAAPRPPLVLVVTQESGLSSLSRGQLRSIYLGDVVKDPGGNRIVPMNQMPNTPDRVAFDRRVLGMSPDEVGRYWTDRRLRGQGAPPRSFESPVLLQRLIMKLPGSITYVRLDQVIPGVKMLKLDGAGPKDPGYPLAEAGA